MDESPLDMNYAAKQIDPQDQPTDLSRTFHTAMVASHAAEATDSFAEIFSLADTPEFRAILAAARELARVNGVSEQEACEKIIRTFRKMDQIWMNYLCKEGRDRLLKC